eukprot:CAMPEP_0194229764 /NCGR_PEP_ID=MMETSP0156-20130528/44059_1 /TAXON_ID=33649 /ORGANISM="Thalassionema nitzschioides, Strain L26-B" /LENGTH=391 /DNA_ID=CAMNT_0038962323 /DNA_START=108 /DNA_END=1283 /DNA_ORIENTATION=-
MPKVCFRLPLFLFICLFLSIKGKAFTTNRAENRTKQQASVMETNSSSDSSNNNLPLAGKLEELKLREAELSRLLAEVRLEKLSTLRSRPLNIGVIGFGRFGRFIAKSFQKYGRVFVTSRSDYTEIASEMGVKYIPLSNPSEFLDANLDVIVVAVSILSFEKTISDLALNIRNHLAAKQARENSDKVQGPLIVDVLSVKEHARQVMLELLPLECDILCTHPMFGPDSGKDGWSGLNFVYEKTRVDGVIFNPNDVTTSEEFNDVAGKRHSIHEDNESLIEGIDRIERFLSIWEEEGCRMIPMSCKAHDSYAANSQFITHLMGRILGEQGLSNTPIDTKGFESVLQLIDTTTADSFDLFYGLYKFNQNSMKTIARLQAAMDNVVEELKKTDSTS